MSAMPAVTWAPTETDHPELPTRPPEALDLLLAHLTEHGRERFAQQLAAALQGPDPTAALSRVFRSWWYTLVLRHHPGHAEAMRRPPPRREDAVYQTTEELRAALDL